MAHREGIREYLHDNADVYGVVHDWGCGTKPIKNYLKYKGDVKFIGIDKLDHVGADLVADFEERSCLIGELADFAFLIEVIEHVWDVEFVLANIRANLKEGGVLYISQPFMYEVHKEDDRVRYTHHGLKQLLEEAQFSVEDISPTGGDLDHAWGYMVKAIA